MDREIFRRDFSVDWRFGSSANKLRKIYKNYQDVLSTKLLYFACKWFYVSPQIKTSQLCAVRDYKIYITTLLCVFIAGSSQVTVCLSACNVSSRSDLAINEGNDCTHAE